MNLVSGRWLTDPVTRLCLAHAGLRSTKVTNKNRSTAVDWSYKSTKRQADWSFFTATPPLEALCSLLICATIDELTNEVGLLAAWTEPVVLMLIAVHWAHFYSPARRKVFVELPEEAGTDKSKVGRLLRSMYGCRDAGVTFEFGICQVMIAIGFVQGRASPSIYRHLETQFRVEVHGDDFCSSRLHRQCKMVLCETARVLG